MFKAVLVSCLFFINVYSSSILNDKIHNLIGNQEYAVHQNLVKFLFKNEHQYLNGNKILYIPLIKKLQDNGLLKLGFAQAQNITFEFRASYDAIKTLKIFRDTLKSLGYYYYFIKNTTYTKEGQLIWTIQVKTEAAINPLILSKELLKNSCQVVDITRIENNKWIYTVDTRNGSIFEANDVLNNETIKLSKPLRPYFLKVNKKAKSITIRSRILNIWFPYVAFYDEDLNILSITKKDEKTKSIRIPLPENTKYIKIKDQFSLINIKRGLSITIKE